jgi:hypothetical protein
MPSPRQIDVGHNGWTLTSNVADRRRLTSELLQSSQKNADKAPWDFELISFRLRRPDCRSFLASVQPHNRFRPPLVARGQTNAVRSAYRPGAVWYTCALVYSQTKHRQRGQRQQRDVERGQASTWQSRAASTVNTAALAHIGNYKKGPGSTPGLPRSR